MALLEGAEPLSKILRPVDMLKKADAFMSKRK